MSSDIRATIPNEPLFNRLLNLSTQVQHPILRDSANDVDATYKDLLKDILTMQLELKRSLPSTLFESGSDILREEDAFIFILAPAGYPYAVAALAVLSIGGAYAPLATGTTPDEGRVLMQRSNARCIVADETHIPLARKCQKSAAAHAHDVTLLPISWPSSPDRAKRELIGTFNALSVDQGLTLAQDSPGILLFTSGTTGPPKGVVHSCRFLDSLRTLHGPDEVVLNHQPIHWMRANITLMGCLLGGARVEIMSSGAAALWTRLAGGGVTTLGCPPSAWSDMMVYHNEVIQRLPGEQQYRYISAIHGLKIAFVSAWMPNPVLVRFWRDEMRVPLVVCYGSTEMGGTVIRTDADGERVHDCSIGRPVPGVTVRLSDGDHGEILLKKDIMFSRYIADDAATAATFNSDGFYKTGDYAYRTSGGEYIMEGRASSDFIQREGSKVPMLQAELRLLELPFVAEGCILPIPASDLTQRLAALVRLRDKSPCKDEEQTLSENGPNEVFHDKDGKYLPLFRCELGKVLPAFMLPNALRILRDGEEIPRTTTGKVCKANTVREFFLKKDGWEIQECVEICGLKDYLEERVPRDWDWGEGGGVDW
ncbi:hypothetical protein BDW69DRAFT_190476 [Aspergillus filifer]